MAYTTPAGGASSLRLRISIAHCGCSLLAARSPFICPAAARSPPSCLAASPPNTRPFALPATSHLNTSPSLPELRRSPWCRRTEREVVVARRRRGGREGVLEPVPGPSAAGGAAESFFRSEIRRRLAVTAALIVLSRVGYFIPLLGFDRRLIPDSYLSFSPLPADNLGDFSSELKLSFFQLGISHQISASIVMQLAGVVAVEVTGVPVIPFHPGKEATCREASKNMTSFCVIDTDKQLSK